MAILIVLLIIVLIYFAYSKGKSNGETEGIAKASGGMRIKYSRLLEHILQGHGSAQIFKESADYILAGVSNMGGTTLFHIKQSANNQVKVTYEIKNNPVCPIFTIEYNFPDDMDQDLMMDSIGNGIQNKMKSFGMMS